jgi:chromate transporter
VTQFGHGPTRGAERVTLTALFTTFLKVSMLAFGGGIVWAHRAVVDRLHWLSEEEFADTVSLCQFLPGPNVIGIAVCVGAKLRGLSGALAAMAGFTIIPGTLGFCLGVLLERYADVPVLRHALAGVSAAAAGLMMATGIRLQRPHRARPVALMFAVLAFGGLIVFRLPLLVVLVGLLPFSIAAAGIARARTA